MVREEIIVPTVKGFSRKQDNSWDYYVCDDPKIAYLRITQFTPDTYEKLKEAIEPQLGEMKGLILDLRFNQPNIGVVALKTTGDAENVVSWDTFLTKNDADGLVHECLLLLPHSSPRSSTDYPALPTRILLELSRAD